MPYARSETQLRERAVSLQFILDSLSGAGNELNMIVLDACRDNPFGWARSGSRGLSVVSRAPTGSIVMYAAGAGQPASDGTGRNGLFTGHLLKNLTTPGISVFDVFDKTMGDVIDVTRGVQHPELSLRFAGATRAFLGQPPAQALAQPPAQAQAVTPPVQPAPTPVPAVQPASTPAAPQQHPAPANMVRINGGTFSMGSPSRERDRQKNEGPQRQVTVSSFFMGKHQVTQREWQEVTGTNPSHIRGDNLPVENVTWFDVIEYCNLLSRREGLTPAYTITGRTPATGYPITAATVTWNRNANGYRLPTEAEWEYACRAGTKTPFSTGNNITTGQANYDGNYPYNNNAKGEYRQRTTPVGSFAANPWGLHDMHGNVWEWCWDWYDGYPSGAQRDPAGAVSGYYRVMRGGSCCRHGRLLRSAFRYGSHPDGWSIDYGFRLVRP